jgi:hypothetical protein
MPFTGLSDVSTYAGAKPFFGSKPAYFDFSSSNMNVQGHKLSTSADALFPRASPPVLSMSLQTVKFIVKKSKCAGLA